MHRSKVHEVHLPPSAGLPDLRYSLRGDLWIVAHSAGYGRFSKVLSGEQSERRRMRESDTYHCNRTADVIGIKDVAERRAVIQRLGPAILLELRLPFPQLVQGWDVSGTALLHHPENHAQLRIGQPQTGQAIEEIKKESLQKCERRVVSAFNAALTVLLGYGAQSPLRALRISSSVNGGSSSAQNLCQCISDHQGGVNKPSSTCASYPACSDIVASSIPEVRSSCRYSRARSTVNCSTPSAWR